MKHHIFSAAVALLLSSGAAFATTAAPAGTPSTGQWWGTPGARAEDSTYRKVAGNAAEGFYVGADFMYLTADAKPNYPDSFMGGSVFAGYRFNKYMAVEVSYGRTARETEKSELFPGLPLENKVQLEQAVVDVMGRLPVGERVSLLGGVGVGMIEEDREVAVFDEDLLEEGQGSDNNSGGMVRLTGGLEAAITPKLSVRTLARYSMPDVDSIDNFWSYNLGLQYNF